MPWSTVSTAPAGSPPMSEGIVFLRRSAIAVPGSARNIDGKERDADRPHGGAQAHGNRLHPRFARGDQAPVEPECRRCNGELDQREAEKVSAERGRLGAEDRFRVGVAMKDA